MIIDLKSTITGVEVDGWWLFTDVMAERVSEITGLKTIKSFGGHIKTGFPAKDECLYTGRIVKSGYKLCITQ